MLCAALTSMPRSASFRHSRVACAVLHATVASRPRSLCHHQRSPCGVVMVLGFVASNHVRADAALPVACGTAAADWWQLGPG